MTKQLVGRLIMTRALRKFWLAQTFERKRTRERESERMGEHFEVRYYLSSLTTLRPSRAVLGERGECRRIAIPLLGLLAGTC